MRCVKLFLPSRDKINEFIDFLKFCAANDIDTVMLEIGGAMEFFRHPEINRAWEEYARPLCKDPDASFRLQYSNNFPKNSVHCENGGGSFLKQEEVKYIASCCAKNNLRVIPEVPSLTHCDYLLCAHKELAERKEDAFPDHYCPSDERVYRLLFDVLEEVIDVFRPEIVNVGHDELYSVGVCPRCINKNAEDIYVEDIVKIYSFLKEKNIRTAMWADKLLCSRDKTGHPYGGNELKMVYTPEEGGGTVIVPAVYRAVYRLPRDILLFHWHYLFGEETDKLFSSLGYEYLLANLTPVTVPDLARRLESASCKGFCISNWGNVDPVLLQRNGIYFHIAYMSCLKRGVLNADVSLSEAVAKVSDLLYRQRLADTKQKYLYVVHTAKIIVDHREFVDGNYMDYDKDYLGCYKIVYEDNTVQYEKIYFGLNINYEKRNYTRKIDSHFDLYETEKYLLESTRTCRYIINGDVTDYEYAFKRISESKVLSWEFLPAEGRENAVEVLSFFAE